MYPLLLAWQEAAVTLLPRPSMLSRQNCPDYGSWYSGLWDALGLSQTGMTAADFEPGDWLLGSQQTPIKRWINPEEVAEINLFWLAGGNLPCKDKSLPLMVVELK